MLVKDFLSLNNLKKVNKDLNDFIEKNRWDDSKLILSWHGFVENQCVGYGRNGASTLVDLQKILHECESIDIVRPYNSNSSCVEIFIKAKAHAGQKGHDTFTRMRMKDGKGKVFTMDDFSVDSLISRFGRVYKEPEMPAFMGSNVLQFSNSQEQQEDISEQVYQEWIDILKYGSQDKFAKMLLSHGYEFIDLFDYTHQFSFHPESVKVAKNKITFAYMTGSTYNSLPVIVCIEKKSTFKEVSLASLGIEKPGYYSHSDKMTILPEQQDEVVKFQAQFKKALK